MKSILVVIPARGDSKGIPRKNIRRLGDKPLIYYVIENGLNSKYVSDLYVTSDDDEILHIAESLGSKIHKRSQQLATDKVTLDPVVHEAFTAISKKEKKNYDYVITMQPTSPVLKHISLDKAIEKMLTNEEIDTIISAKEDTHLTWREENGIYVPNYAQRVNRQELEPIYKETGGFVITKSEFIEPHNRLGKKIDLFLLSDGEEIDIDDYKDWSICEYYLNRKHIVFVVTGNKQFGLGHVYNTLIIANDLTNHHISFLVDAESELAYTKIRSKNFNVYKQHSNSLAQDVIALAPDIVINDKLDTSYQYMKVLKENNIKVINIEDRGSGARLADMVINAIYSSKEFLAKHYFGYHYYVIRDEFLLKTPKKIVNRSIQKILISFGGTDPNNLTFKVLDAIEEFCTKQQIEINIVAGIGYEDYKTLECFKNIKIHRNVTHISKFMLEADLIFAAMGRTLYEVAYLGIPAVVIAQNERELSHTFGYGQHGFINLGLFDQISKDDILNSLYRVLSYETRASMNELLLQHDLKSGRKRVVTMINDLISR